MHDSKRMYKSLLYKSQSVLLLRKKAGLYKPVEENKVFLTTEHVFRTEIFSLGGRTAQMQNSVRMTRVCVSKLCVCEERYLNYLSVAIYRI